MIYAIQVKSGPVKIGRCEDIRKRLAGLQTNNHEMASVVWMFQHPLQKPIERHLHDHFAEYRIHREWFSEEVLETIDEVAHRYAGDQTGIPQRTKEKEHLYTAESLPAFIAAANAIAWLIEHYPDDPFVKKICQHP